MFFEQRKYGFSLKRNYHNFSTVYLNSQQEPRCSPVHFDSELRRNITYQNVETMCVLSQTFLFLKSRSTNVVGAIVLLNVDSPAGLVDE